MFVYIDNEKVDIGDHKVALIYLLRVPVFWLQKWTKLGGNNFYE